MRKLRNTEFKNLEVNKKNLENDGAEIKTYYILAWPPFAHKVLFFRSPPSYTPTMEHTAVCLSLRCQRSQALSSNILEGLIKHKTQATDSWVSEYIKDNADLQEKPSWTQEPLSKSKPLLEPLWLFIALPGLKDTWAGSNLTFLSP